MSRRLAEMQEYLKRYIGYSGDDFKYFGDGFGSYDEFREFQIEKICSLSKHEIKQLMTLIKLLQQLKPRHIDFYNPGEQYVINGIYFAKSGRLMTFSSI